MSIDPRLGESIAARRRQSNLDRQGLHAGEVLEATLSQVESSLCLPCPPLAQFDSREVLSVVVYAAATGSALEPAGRALKEAPSPNTVRERLKLVPWVQLEAQVNAALCTPGVQHLLRRPCAVAVDVNEIPFYGQIRPEEAEWIWKRRARQGTSHFYVYATAYVIHQGQRVTLAVHPCRVSQGLLGAVQGVWAHLQRLGVQVHCLFMDREFYQVAILRYLKAVLDVPFCMAAPQKGSPQGEGLKALALHQPPGVYSYTVRSPKEGAIEVTVALVGHYLKGRWSKHQRVRYSYVLHRFPWAFSAIHDQYRSRFGIESSYRLKEQTRARTTSPSSALRLLWVGLSLVLQNVWVWLQWACVALPHRGGRQILYRLFSFFRMRQFLQGAIEEMYQLVESVKLRARSP